MIPPPSRAPKWLQEMQARIEARAINMRVLLHNFDTDNSGTVDVHELRSGLKRVGMHLNEQEFLELLEVRMYYHSIP